MSEAPVWEPDAQLREHSAMAALIRERGMASYEELWRWSVADIGRFWGAIWRRYEILADGDPAVALADASMPGARWFPDVALSFPEQVFRDRDPAAIAVHFTSEGSGLDAWTWGELAACTAAIRAGLRRLGIGRGDRVAGLLPNLPETLAAFLAASSLGATWSCCSPDLGAPTVADRFAQIEPQVLLAVDGYRYGGREHSCEATVAELVERLPSLRRVVRLALLGGEGDWEEAFPPTAEPLAFERVPFDHPLWVLYSSGTTGPPKAIVHGHGGILLEHLKTWDLHHAAGAGDRVLWFTTTGWVMWNYLVAALLTPASIVLFDGNPGHPSLDTLWELVERAGVTWFGAGAAFHHGCMAAGLRPGREHDLSRLRAVGSTGSPLAPEAYRWIRDSVGEHVWPFPVSGGTDIAGAFVGGCPVLPVYAGEIQVRWLGVAVEAWDEQGRPVEDEVGELVVREPMPSMPVGFWGDPGDERYRESYFSMYPGVWRHGDWIRITPRGGAVIYGRSDSTINRGGIRIGSGEIYAALLGVEAIEDALAVDVPSLDAAADARMSLFLVLSLGAELDAELHEEIAARLRRACSPRHVPDELVAVPAIPRTLTGKLLEVPVKKLLSGADPAGLANRDSLADPQAWDWFVEYAAGRS